MLSRGGREGEEEVTGGKVNYDLMSENILKGGISWCVHKFKAASADLSIMNRSLSGGLRTGMPPYFMVYFML